MLKQTRETSLQPTLLSIQLRLSVQAGRQLTQGDLALIARVNLRSIGEWMRGSTSPASGAALLRLLSVLPAEELRVVLDPWKTDYAAILASGKKRRERGSRARAGRSVVRRKSGRRKLGNSREGK
jgi:DNA-binding transcriptional regulator YiaG